jgi:LAO/AO transport system kinase
VPDLVAGARAGEARAVARLISLVEEASPLFREAMALLAPDAGHAFVIGLTGPPGVGKSTITTSLVTAFRARGSRVAVLAVDPSSPFSGGALLGDRVRMQEHATDPGVYIRSMATRGHLGGLAWATAQALRVLDAAHFDVALVETVGVGQSEIEVASTADSVVVLLAPGMGDGIQAAKAGILEIGDVYAVNKADRDGADATVRELRNVLRMGAGAPAAGQPSRWVPPVVKTVASQEGGIIALVEALDGHRAWLTQTGALTARRRGRAAAQIRAVAMAAIGRRLDRLGDATRALADQVAEGSLDPYTAAQELVELV